MRVQVERVEGDNPRWVVGRPLATYVHANIEARDLSLDARLSFTTMFADAPQVSDVLTVTIQREPPGA